MMGILFIQQKLYDDEIDFKTVMTNGVCPLVKSQDLDELEDVMFKTDHYRYFECILYFT